MCVSCWLAPVPSEQECRFQKGLMILNGHQTSDAANHKGFLRKTKFAAHCSSCIAAWRKALRIHAVVNHVHPFRPDPCLPRVEIAQFARQSKYSIGHGVCCIPEEPPS